uniref:60s ribosomal protein l9 n=1 Tax=Pfiesteria piscicida TaxID=71001 RepID=E8Z6A8_PFIPI|nr:60s ribosomal protein l9 [Pfiesteria piscicida]
MRKIHSERVIAIPSGVEVAIKSRKVRVKGPRGVLSKDFNHLDCDLRVINGGRAVKLEVWFGRTKALACMRTCTSHINNMVTGVTKGFEYKMRFVYAHFPVNAIIEDDGTVIHIKNFLGEKVTRTVKMLDGVSIVRSDNVKDEIVLSGNNIENVSQSAALIQQSCNVKNKDIRKFLDGIYVSEKGVIGGEE